MLHHRRVLLSVLRFEKGVERWSCVDPDLKDLATVVSAQIGCSGCMDFGSYLSRNRGMDRARLEAIPEWRTRDLYSPLERRVLGYAEAMTATPPEVTDEMVRALRQGRHRGAARRAD